MSRVSDHEVCTACGFDGATHDDAALLVALRALGGQWRMLLDSAGPELRVRPAPAVWSAIEYAEHTRDIVALHVYGVKEALTGTEPVLPPVDPGLADAAAVAYGDADPGVVAGEIDTHARRMAEPRGRRGPRGLDARYHPRR